MLKKFLYFISIPLFFINISFVLSQSLTPTLEKLNKEITALTYSNKYDSAQALVLNFLDQKNLSELEIFYGHYLFGDVLKSSLKSEEAIKQLLKSKNYLLKIQKKEKYESLVNAKIAEAWFDVSNFQEAKKYAQLSIQMNPDSSLRSGGHAINYIILGYSDYLEKKYLYALDFYNRATMEFLKTKELCELPLCYMKVAKVYNAMKNETEAEENIRKAISISDSCGINQYKLLSLYTILDIYKENKKFKEALETLEKINELVKELHFHRQQDLMSELEVKFETKLAQNENENLREINLKNKEILSQQKRALIITVFAIFILSVLIFLIFKISNQRKKALVEIKNKTRQIELQNKELERLHQLNQKIFSVISHDFRGPIISLQLLLKALQSQTLNTEQISDYTSDLSHQLTGAKNVMENLLNWARIELDTTEEINSSSNPFLIAEEIYQQQKNIADKKHIKIQNRIPERLLLKIPPDILQIVFRNLLSNAIKFSYEDSEIVLEYDEKNNFILVKDSGMGMDEIKLNTLFSPKVETTLGTAKESGFGFGLYIVHEILHRFQGSISAEPGKPAGTVFKIGIPKS